MLKDNGITAFKYQTQQALGSEEVVRKCISISSLLVPWLHVLMHIVLRGSCEHVEESLARIANFEYARHIAATITVVRRTPDRAEAVVVKYLETLLTELVGAEDV